MSRAHTIRLSVPGELRFRDVAVRAVASACRLVGSERAAAVGPIGPALDLADHWDAEAVSAFSEIFNNIVIHAYGDQATGEIFIEMMPERDHLAIVVSDHGRAFDLSQVPAPELETLPEGGMGIHIARACVDELLYVPGPPNVWRLTKYHGRGSTGGAIPARRLRATTSQG